MVIVMGSCHYLKHRLMCFEIWREIGVLHVLQPLTPRLKQAMVLKPHSGNDTVKTPPRTDALYDIVILARLTPAQG